MEKLILVNQNNQKIGEAEKIAAHKQGRLHRAFSVFVFNRQGQLLLQKRACGKYHSAGRWSNTCCGHPRPGERTRAAARRRLQEEMGFDCVLRPAGSFIYRTKFGNGLIENEFDQLFIGQFDGEPKPDPKEAEEWKWIGFNELKKELKKRPERFSFWLEGAVEKMEKA